MSYMRGLGNTLSQAEQDMANYLGSSSDVSGIDLAIARLAAQGLTPETANDSQMQAAYLGYAIPVQPGQGLPATGVLGQVAHDVSGAAWYWNGTNWQNIPIATPAAATPAAAVPAAPAAAPAAGILQSSFLGIPAWIWLTGGAGLVLMMEAR
jgi:hypothetical protein